MKKRRVSALLALVMVLSLAACGAGADAEPDGVELTVMGKQSDLEKSYMTSIFEQYEEATGNRLKLITYEDSEYETKAARAFEKGDGPDIFLHFHNADLRRFDVAGNFYYLNDEDWVVDLTDSARAYCEDGEGNLLGLPFWENSVSGCYYNKTILDSLGLQPPVSQAGFDVLCQSLKDAGYAPICWPADGCSWMIQFALDPVFADHPELLEELNQNKITYADIPAVRDMVQWAADAADKGWFGNGFLECGWDQISPVMSSGKAVMTFIWDTWFYTDMQKDGKYTVEDFALMPVFLNTADSGTYEGGNLNMMMANKNSEHLEEVLDFLDFCATARNYNTAFDGISTVNCFKGQTTNIQSPMVTDSSVSVEANTRASIAASRIIGFSGDDVAEAFNRMFRGKTDVDGCIALLDKYRIGRARKQGAEGF